MSQFHWADYVVFVVVLFISMATGIYFACTGKKQRDTEEFLMAGRRMNLFPVAFSIFVSWMSAISFIGDPVECYTYGFIYILLVLGYMIGVLPAALYFAPQFHKQHIISVYEYLETRYNKFIRLLCSLLAAISTVLWLGIATYAPALALSQASGIPVWSSIVLIGAVCTFYTTLGGMKAVLWADTLQMMIMLAGQIAIVVRGTMRVGGVGEVLRIATEGGRLNFQESLTQFNPLARASMWINLIGGMTRVFNPYVSSQMIVQRYCTVRTPQEARCAVLLNIPMFAVMSSMIAFNGLVMYAVYHDCDPLWSGQIERRDQMVPFLVIDLLGFLPGVPGLFLATVFSASLSTLSSGMNGLSAMGLTDMALPLYKWRTGKPMSRNFATYLAKFLAIVAGLVITGVSFLPQLLGTSIFGLTSLVMGITSGPTTGLYTMGMLFPRVRSLHILIGFVFSAAVCLAIGVAALIMPPRESYEELPFSTSGCPSHANMSTSMRAVASTDSWSTSSSIMTARGNTLPPFRFEDIYHLNPLLYATFGLLIVMFVSGVLYALSWCYERILGREEEDYTNHYRSPSCVQDDTVTRIEGDEEDKLMHKYQAEEGKRASLSLRGSRVISPSSAARRGRNSFKTEDNNDDKEAMEMVLAQ